MEHKGFLLVTGSMGMVGIKPKGRGSVPKNLRGAYTTKSWAMRAIDTHLSRKEKVNVEAEATS